MLTKTVHIRGYSNIEVHVRVVCYTLKKLCFSRVHQPLYDFNGQVILFTFKLFGYF